MEIILCTYSIPVRLDLFRLCYNATLFTGAIMFEITSSVPTPAAYQRRKYPFGELEVGQSFFVPRDQQMPKIVRNAADAYAKAHGIKLIVRTVPGGAQCWRTA